MCMKIKSKFAGANVMGSKPTLCDSCLVCSQVKMKLQTPLKYLCHPEGGYHPIIPKLLRDCLNGFTGNLWGVFNIVIILLLFKSVHRNRNDLCGEIKFPQQ